MLQDDVVSSSCVKEEEELEEKQEGQEDLKEQGDQEQEQTQEHVTPRRKDRMSRSGAVTKVLFSLGAATCFIALKSIISLINILVDTC